MEGSLPFQNAALRVGVDLSDLEGELTGTAKLGPDGDLELDGDFTIRHGSLAGRAIERWEGQLRQPRGDRWVYLQDLHGRIGDGDALGTLQIDPETSEYQMSLTLRDVSAAQLLPPPKDRPGHGFRGRVDGSLFLRGKGTEISSRRGGGDVRIRGSSFVQTPLLSSLAQAGRREGAALADTVDRTDVRFLLEGYLVRVQRIEIRSRDLRLIGEGTWDRSDDTLHLTLVGANPESWPQVAVLSKLLESAGQKLLQYRVEGTLGAPQVTAEPLHELNATLRGLIGEGQE
jgi:hypothetical protein